MSWFERPSPVLAAAALLAMGFGLGGCFTPLYGSLGGGLGGELRAVAVDPVPDKLGHYLRDQLITDLNGTGDRPAPRYRLQLATSERVQTALIDVTTQRPTEATVVTDVTWTLLPIGGGPPVATGKATSFASYDRSAQRFANIRAAREAEIRDAKTLADEITTQVAARLGGRKPAP
jgi:LPS-assembly lipoprotein